MHSQSKDHADFFKFINSSHYQPKQPPVVAKKNRKLSHPFEALPRYSSRSLFPLLNTLVHHAGYYALIPSPPSDFYILDNMFLSTHLVFVGRYPKRSPAYVLSELRNRLKSLIRDISSLRSKMPANLLSRTSTSKILLEPYPNDPQSSTYIQSSRVCYAATTPLSHPSHLRTVTYRQQLTAYPSFSSPLPSATP